MDSYKNLTTENFVLVWVSEIVTLVKGIGALTFVRIDFRSQIFLERTATAEQKH